MQDRTKRRKAGRPREFDEGEALGKMQRQLWTTGLSGVSLDSIARSAGLNRPSLAAAFGNKDEIYAQAAAKYVALMDERLSKAIDAKDMDLALKNAFEAAIDIYRRWPGRMFRDLYGSGGGTHQSGLSKHPRAGTPGD